MARVRADHFSLDETTFRRVKVNPELAIHTVKP
jgi:hypothetical protein